MGSLGFRILPLKTKLEREGSYIHPIKLLKVTDFSGNSLKVKTIHQYDALIWKIGDSSKTISGLQNYLIHYKVGNAIRFTNNSFDEFYWNILDNFWELEIKKFSAQVILSEDITRDKVRVDYYIGYLGSKRTDLVKLSWLTPNVIYFFSDKSLLSDEGITVSLAMPKNIFKLYQLTFLDIYSYYLKGQWYVLIFYLFAFVISLVLWYRYGNDPHFKKNQLCQSMMCRKIYRRLK